MVKPVNWQVPFESRQVLNELLAEFLTVSYHNPATQKTTSLACLKRKGKNRNKMDWKLNRDSLLTTNNFLKEVLTVNQSTNCSGVQA